MPVVKLSPISPTKLMVESGVSVMKASVIGSFNQININDQWNKEMTAYLTTFISPGYVSMTFEMTELRKREPLDLLSLMFAKLLFFHSTSDRRFSNITARSVELIDELLVNMLCDLEVLESKDGSNSPKRFRDCLPSASLAKGGKLKNYLYLDTDGTGKGWTNGTDNSFCTDDPGSFMYPNCPLRQRFVTKIDNKRDKSSRSFSSNYKDWKTYNAIFEIAKVLESKPSYRGVSAIIQCCGRRLFDFFILMNIYLKERWYCGFRATDSCFTDTSEESEDQKVCPISGRCILFLAKSMCEDSGISSNSEYDVQYKAECGVAHQAAKFGAVYSMLSKQILDLKLTAVEFKRSELIDMALPESGALRLHFDYLKEISLISSLEDSFFTWTFRTGVGKLFERVSNNVLKNDSTYNLAPSFLRFPQIIPVTIDELRKHALDDTPYLNGTPEGMPVPIELDLRTMCTLVAKHEFRTFVHEKSMSPIRFTLPTKII
jgi:hypothetical protein